MRDAGREASATVEGSLDLRRMPRRIAASAIGRLRGMASHKRAAYGSVWDSVSYSPDGAVMSVIGTNDEHEFQRSALETRDRLIECVGVQPSDVVLEIGAGVGRVGSVMAPICREWIGADVSRHMLAHMERRLAEFDNVRLVLLSGYDLAGLPDSAVDLVYCTVVFMHLDEWERYSYVREAYRVLRPGGRLYVDNFDLTLDKGWAFFLKNLTDYAPMERPPNISKSSTPQELECYLARAGFAGITLRTYDDLWIASHGGKPTGQS